MTQPVSVELGARPADPPSLDAGLLRLLADPLRSRLVGLLAAEQLCTCHLASATGALPSAVSNQLRHLREAGLVEREAAGRYTYYRLRPEALRALGAQLAEVADAAARAVRRPC
jgi:ArsR family transcriptional regulator